MRSLTWTTFAAILLLASLSAPARAQDFWEEEFSNDQDPALDQFEPNTRDPIAEPDAGGLPPIDWRDARTGWPGLIEENLSPVGDVGYPAPDPGANTPEYGVVQQESGDGPYWDPLSFDQDCLTLCYNIDVYADPVPAPGEISGNPDVQVPDFWWTNAVGTPSSFYLTESGITGLVTGLGTWTFSTTAQQAIVTVPTGLWYELEVCFKQGLDGTLDAVHTVYDATGTIALGSVTQTFTFLNPVNQPIGPSYSWFTNFRPNLDVLFVDDFRVECVVPEPSSIALLAMGAVGLAAVGRRRLGRPGGSRASAK